MEKKTPILNFCKVMGIELHFYNCPNCNNSLTKGDEKCKECGIELDWEEWKDVKE
jgi:predicted amidophosphoribosyltransferase